jgi:membrane-associated PAP2 superfamily phosphatase
VSARDEARFVVANLSGLALIGALLVWLSRDGALDFRLAGAFFDPATSGFPLKDAALLAQGGHTALRWVAVLVWISAVALAVAGRKVAALRPWRASLGFFSVIVVVVTVSVTLIRHASAHSCPWDLRIFGGSALWFPLFDAPGPAPGPGHCWPGGHAAGGFSLLAGYFALRDGHQALARVVLALALGLGLVMSLVQMARGAHFLTHNLWSLWIAWFCAAMGYLVWRRLIYAGRSGRT